MAINTINQMVAAISAGQQYKYMWNKQTGPTTAYVAGRWYATETLAGSPPAETFAGSSASTAWPLDSSRVGWMPTGGTAGSVTPSVKNLTSIECVTSTATGVPSWLMLVDLLMVYPSIPLTASPTALTNVATLPRYTSGAGVMMFMELATSTGVAANLTLTYYNSAGVPVSHTTPGTIALNTATAVIPLIVHSGTSANNFGPFIPLAAGDSGVTSVTNVALSGTGAGTAHLFLCKPLVQIPLTQQYYPSGRDYVFNMPNLPVITEAAAAGAYLSFLLYAGAAVAQNAQFAAGLDYVWG